MRRRNVRRVIRWFNRDTDELAGSAPMLNLDLRALQAMYDRPSDDPMYDCYPIGPIQATQLQAYVGVPIDLTRYDYFIESEMA